MIVVHASRIGDHLVTCRWVACEETEARAGEDGFLLDHGYVFEVDPASQDANTGKSPVPRKFLGWNAHEAVRRTRRRAPST
ncbi:hypothetical protein ROP_54600 [Rhodococcus opacus B4]|uniref:Uncharacterized protein n=1 Tax=Rhodococcus opacus (strain B4) TaxID=632772 RepID=C1AWD4_RHOOB|nr:hypothetical protein ROP_54600 [Rhodococcus opacus B4]